MSKGLVEAITELIKPQAPYWACELTSKHVIVSGINSARTRITNTFMEELPANTSIVEAARPVVGDLLQRASFKGSEIAVVVPDASARIAFLSAESLSKTAEEQRAFIRWKLKKSVPFDVDTAQVAYRVLGPHRGGTGVDLLVALAPKSVVEEYETLFEPLDIHAGMVLPSTLAALNLLPPAEGDTLFVKVAPDCVTTTVFQNQRVQFYRRVTDVSLYDAVYPTVLYYQDKLGGNALNRMLVCDYDDEDLQRPFDEIREKLGLTAIHIGPKGIPDIYKPALGATHLRPEAL